MSIRWREILFNKFMPFGKLLVVFVAVRDREKEMYRVRTRRACSYCGVVGPALRKKFWKDLAVFGIPVFTWKREVQESCSACGKVLQKKPASFMQSVLWYFS